MKKQLLKTMFLSLMTLVASSAWAQTTWQFANNKAMWEAVTLNGGAQYDENANTVTSGGVTFTGERGFVATDKGIGFNAVGSTTDENISFVVPAGYKATVSVYTSSNRTAIAEFGETKKTYGASWASTTHEFINEDATGITLYLYCNQNPGGDNTGRAPFLETIVLTDLASVKSYPWTANAVATIGGTKTTIKTYNSSADVDEGSQYAIIVDKIIKYDDNYYVLNDSQFDADVYGKIFTMGSEAPTFEFNYEAIEDVAFYGEVEDIYSGGQNANKQMNNSVLSNGGGYSAQSSNPGYVQLTFSVPERAIYKLALGMNNTNSRERGFNYAIDGADVSETITVGAGKAFVQEIADQTLEAGEHTMTLNITYSLTPIFDYLLITKTGEAAPVANKTIGLVPGVWAVDGATFAVYAWNDGGSAWFPFVEADGAYGTQIPENYTGIILTRINPEGTDADPWKNVWNQTDDIDFTTIDDGTVFTITGWGEDGANSTYTTEEVVVDDLTALKEQLAKAIELASAFGADTTAGEALLANPDATREQLTAALQAIIEGAKPKAQEVVTLAKAFFAKFDNVAGEALAPYIAAAEAALEGTDFDALYNSAMALFAQGLIEGQSAMTKVNSYLEKMGNETINNDLAALNAAVGKKDLKDIVAALRQLKNDLPDAAMKYAVEVKALIDEGKDAGNDVSEMEAAYNNAMSTAVSYKMGSASLVDVGYALYELIKAVEAYKEALNAPAYYLVGTMTNWVGDGVKEEYKLTLNEAADGGAEEYMITLDLQAGDEFKIVKNGKELVWYPDGVGNNYTVTEAGNCTVYFRPNGDGGSDWFYNVICVVNNTTTGLHFVNTDSQNAVIYNLSGQKVVKAQKGLYIINGKKVMMK